LRKVVFLDSGVLGKLTHPRGNEDHRECLRWLLSLLRAGVRVCIPEVCDYELRRVYLFRDAQKQLAKLDELKSQAKYVAINTDAMRRAATLWAQGRRRGRPTAGDKALDADVILCAQALLEVVGDEELVVATTDVGDLSTFVTARAWRAIPP